MSREALEYSTQIMARWAVAIGRDSAKPMLCISINNIGKTSIYSDKELDPSVLVVVLRQAADNIEKMYLKKQV